MPPSARRSPPSYRLHKPTGQAVVTLNGQDFYLGKHGTEASREAYDRRIAEWLASGRQIVPKDTAARAVTVTEVVAAFWRHAEQHYVKPDGSPTSELSTYKYV